MTIYTQSKGSGENVVLLHGCLDNHCYMQPIMDQLCAHYCVLTLDEPGIGNSAWQPHIQNIHDLADAILPVLPPNAIYIGWSFGGLIATSLAARYPERVRRIINIASAPKFIEDVNWPGVPLPGFKQIFPTLETQGLTAILKHFHDSEFEKITPKPDAYHQLNHLLDNLNVNVEAIKKRVSICDATDLRQEFKKLTCPIDLIFGDNDETVPIALHDRIKRLNTNVNLQIISGGQHLIQWTHHAEMNRILETLM